MPQRGQASVRIADEVAAARAAGRPVVALETSIVAHGLPRPDNVEVGRAMAAAVRAAGAVPALTGVAAGELRVGLDDDALVRLGGDPPAAKAAMRDLARLATAGAWGGTTVSGTLALAAATGIEVAATGGIGGVHRGAGTSFDVSADLAALARTRAVVVCAGAKSILDLPATLEWLESRSVPVLGWRTDRFPAFYAADAGLKVPRIDNAERVGELARAHWALGGGGIVVAQPPPRPLDLAAVEAWSATAHARAAAAGVAGAAVTPFVLVEMARLSGGRTVAANRELALANAALAAGLASHLGASVEPPDRKSYS
jgi:pseudouridine-5'-phosphate glycosidase